MPREDVQNELQATNRRLRLRIGRLRRRIDGRLHSMQREGRRLVSWKTYVRNYPGSTVMAALGAGLALSAGVQRVKLSFGHTPLRRNARFLSLAALVLSAAWWLSRSNGKEKEDPG